MQSQVKEEATNDSVELSNAPPIALADQNTGGVRNTQVSGATCSNCGSAADLSPSAVAAPAYVFAIGKIDMRFPSLGVEKEFAQAIARTDTAGKTDRAAMHAVLADPSNRYLTRQVCWVLTIEGMETYILVPRDPADFIQLLEAVRPEPSPLDLDVVIGTRGPIAPPPMCNGLLVPMVMFDQIYSFDRDSLIKSIPRPQKVTAKQFAPTAEEVFDRIIQVADNAGATDEHRALNYLAVRYPAIYEIAGECHGRNCSLTGVYVLPSRLAGTRSVVDVIFSFTNRNTDVTEKWFCRVDVTECFPFLVTKLSPYYDR